MNPDKFYPSSKCLSNVFPAETTRLFEYLKGAYPKRNIRYFIKFFKSNSLSEQTVVGAFNIWVCEVICSFLSSGSKI